MKAFTIKLESGSYVLSDSLTNEVVSSGTHKGLRATTEIIKDQIFSEIMKRKIKGA
jgi:hypothetical protein